jgi:immunoglobulin-like protein involved in spore germination/sporulation and spore germination protein
MWPESDAMRRFAGVVLAGFLLVSAGCGDGGGSASRDGTTTVAASTVSPTATVGDEQPVTLQLFLVDPSDHKLYAAKKEIEPTQAVGAAALRALAEDPDSEVPPNLSLAIENGAAKVTGSELSPAALAQVVYTLTQFPTVNSVNGKTRRGVESLVPAILVESPTAESTVSSPVRVAGNANTFEATFEYDLEDENGKVLHHDFVTATSGSGERGTFDFTIPFRVARQQEGTLVVYESSAENGSRINERRIPLTLAP